MIAAAGPDPVLLLHGQPGGARDWDRVIAALGSGAPTIAFDRPGWDGISDATDLAGNAAAALAALDRAGAERAILVGHSFGAAVACAIAAAHPERTAGLVLVAPAANVASLYPADRLLAAPLIGELGALLLVGAPALALRHARTRKVIAGRLGLADEHLAQTGRAFGRRSAWRAFAVEQRSLIRDLPPLEARLSALEARTVVLIGTRDRIIPPNSAHTLAAQIPGAELVVIRRAGHLLPLRRADTVASAIRNLDPAVGASRANQRLGAG